MKRLLLGFALAAAVAASPVNATPTTGLMLLIDDSGSISNADFLLQRNAYYNALSAELPTDGSVAVGVIEFDSTLHTIFTLQTIDATAKANLLSAISVMPDNGGSTATGPAIAQAAALLTAFSPALTKMLIDVSTDGFGNVGISEATASAQAISDGINQVNVLCIGGAANCAFNAGTGSFNLPATFSNIESTLTAKLRRELNIPEPTSVGFVGLAALAVVRRFRRKTA